MIVTITYGTNQTVTYNNVKNISSTDDVIGFVYEDTTAPHPITTKQYKTKELGTYTLSIQPDPEPTPEPDNE